MQMKSYKNENLIRSIMDVWPWPDGSVSWGIILCTKRLLMDMIPGQGTYLDPGLDLWLG